MSLLRGQMRGVALALFFVGRREEKKTKKDNSRALDLRLPISPPLASFRPRRTLPMPSDASLEASVGRSERHNAPGGAERAGPEATRGESKGKSKKGVDAAAAATSFSLGPSFLTPTPFQKKKKT